MVTHDLHSVMIRRDVELLSNGGEKWIEVTKERGLERTRMVCAEAWTDIRTDCYCCSCNLGGSFYVDPYCRNHGTLGRRECETHQMSGDVPIISIEKYTDQVKRERIRRFKKS